jgi:prepilin-type N-terminal cleavage/methylation domain-containing protein
MTRFSRLDRGFSLTEMMLTLATAATLAVIGLPIMKDLTVDIKVNEAARAVERELQDARLRAVSANRPLRVRTNCPVTGQIRSVEYLGDSRDTASNRCSATAYPFPASDDNILTRPNFDGPIRDLPFGTTVTSTILEFQPDGTATNVVSGTPTTIESPMSIVVSRSGRTRTITVNGAGKILLQ